MIADGTKYPGQLILLDVGEVEQPKSNYNPIEMGIQDNTYQYNPGKEILESEEFLKKLKVLTEPIYT